MIINSSKVVMITGANRGIGLALAQEIAKKKSQLILLNRTIDESLKPKLLELGATSVEQISVDLSSEESIRKFLNEWGPRPIDILINNAGQLTGGALLKQEFSEIRNMFLVNVLAVVQLTQGLIPNLKQRSESLIVMNASVSAVMYFPFANTYAASKAALMALSYSLKAELSQTSIKVMTLFTPGIKTRMFNQIEEKYSKDMDTKFLTAISAEDYAARVVKAIEKGCTEIYPRGANAILFFLARLSPPFFAKLVSGLVKKGDT